MHRHVPLRLPFFFLSAAVAVSQSARGHYGSVHFQQVRCDALLHSRLGYNSMADDGETQETWKMMWGAKVQVPADMPDDMLRMAVETSRDNIAAVENWQEDGDKAVAAIKKRFDDTWSPFWHVIVGKNFGSHVTHESRRMCFFYLEDKAVLIYKSA